MKFSALTTPIDDSQTDCLIIGMYADKTFTPAAKAFIETTGSDLLTVLSENAFTGEFKQSLLLHRPTGLAAKRLLLMGLGQPETLDSHSFYTLVQAAFSVLRGLPLSTLVCTLNEVPVNGLNSLQILRSLVQATLMSLYAFDSYKSKKKPESITLKEISFLEDPALPEAVRQGEALSQGLYLARDLANTPCNICHPAYLAAQALMLGESHPQIQVRILEKKALESLKMGALLAVGQGSAHPPKLIELRYEGTNSTEPPVVLVGKGITFDTGGISLKPAAGMENMKYDMAGAAAVLGTFKAIAALNLPLNLVGLIPTAENMPDGNAYRPGDVLTSASGQTIEIVNTDAEGRLVLCDALTYAERFKPAAVIDIATLTGAVVIALGYLFNGVFSRDESLAQSLVEAGKRSFDLAWQLPLPEAYQESLKSNIADMTNASKLAGAITGACFLSRFTEAYPWAHIDCAGTAMPADNQKNEGATGRPVPLLVEYLIDVSSR